MPPDSRNHPLAICLDWEKKRSYDLKVIRPYLSIASVNIVFPSLRALEAGNDCSKNIHTCAPFPERSARWNKEYPNLYRPDIRQHIFLVSMFARLVIEIRTQKIAVVVGKNGNRLRLHPVRLGLSLQDAGIYPHTLTV